MTTTDPAAQAVPALNRSVVACRDGGELTVADVYLDNQTGRPTWVAVITGWSGGTERLAPLSTATIDADVIRLPYDKDMINRAPTIAAGGPLSRSDEKELEAYYGLVAASKNRARPDT